MSVEGLRIECHESVLKITFDTPSKFNALSASMIHAAAEAVEGAAQADIRVILITGAGRAFSAGADVGPGSAPPGLDTLDAANRLTLAITSSPVIVVAAVNGVAAGVGCSFALAADLTIAKESASFMLAFSKIGLMPDGGASILVPAAVGRARAALMALMAEKVGATEAADWGLITKVVPDQEFDSAVAELLTRIAAGPPLALAATKKILNSVTVGNLAEVLKAERSGQTLLLNSADFAEGLAAFQEKRAAHFNGH